MLSKSDFVLKIEMLREMIEPAKLYWDKATGNLNRPVAYLIPWQAFHQLFLTELLHYHVKKLELINSKQCIRRKKVHPNVYVLVTTCPKLALFHAVH